MNQKHSEAEGQVNYTQVPCREFTKILRLTTEIKNILHYLTPAYLSSRISYLLLCNSGPQTVT